MPSDAGLFVQCAAILTRGLQVACKKSFRGKIKGSFADAACKRLNPPDKVTVTHVVPTSTTTELAAPHAPHAPPADEEEVEADLQMKMRAKARMTGYFGPSSHVHMRVCALHGSHRACCTPAMLYSYHASCGWSCRATPLLVDPQTTESPHTCANRTHTKSCGTSH